MKVFVETLEGTNFEIEVKPEDTVADVKKTIETAQGSDVYPSAQQMLIYQEKVLKDNTTLEENKVAENSFIVILLIKGLPNVGSNAAAGPQAHLDAPSTSNMEFRCDICGKAFDSKMKVNRHRPSHSSVPRKCEWCERILRNAGAYTNHINACTKRPSSVLQGLPNVGSNAAAGPQSASSTINKAPETTAPQPPSAAEQVRSAPAPAAAPKSRMRPPKLECRRKGFLVAATTTAVQVEEVEKAVATEKVEAEASKEVTTEATIETPAEEEEEAEEQSTVQPTVEEEIATA